MEIFLIILAAVFLLIRAAAVIFFAVTFTLYFFNLDMKLVRVIYDILGKHYDTMKRDKKL